QQRERYGASERDLVKQDTKKISLERLQTALEYVMQLPGRSKGDYPYRDGSDDEEMRLQIDIAERVQQEALGFPVEPARYDAYSPLRSPRSPEIPIHVSNPVLQERMDAEARAAGKKTSAEWAKWEAEKEKELQAELR